MDYATWYDKNNLHRYNDDRSRHYLWGYFDGFYGDNTDSTHEDEDYFQGYDDGVADLENR